MRENFRRKPLKGNGRGRIREGKERGPPGYFVQAPRVHSYATVTVAIFVFLSSFTPYYGGS